MMTAFDRAFDWIIAVEGGYVNSPADPGGETKYGISKRAYPHLDIKNLTIEQAKEIYYKYYWQKCQCDNLNIKLALCIFDCAVNQGVSAAIRILQACLNIKTDGIIGSQTLSAIGATNTSKLITDFMARRVIIYSSLGSNVWTTYQLGWMRRCFKLMEYIHG